VNFTSTPTGGDSQYTYAWDFGDSSSSNIQNPSHLYTQAGNYNVELTLTDSTGLSIKAARSVTVSAAPVVVVVPPSKVKSSGGGGSMGFGLLLALCFLRIVRK
jgi:PKD repeat protein